MPEEDFRQIAIGSARVGLVGPEALFERIKAAGRELSDELPEELVKRVSRHNYMPGSARAEYAQVLLAEHRRELGEPVPDERGVPSVEILGPGWPNCERPAWNVVQALAQSGIAADVRHATDIVEMARYGVSGTPALAVNSEDKSVGEVASSEEI